MAVTDAGAFIVATWTLLIEKELPGVARSEIALAVERHLHSITGAIDLTIADFFAVWDDAIDELTNGET